MAGGILFHVTYAFPTIATVIIYGTLLYTLKKKAGITEATRMRMRSMSKMTQGVVVAVIVCNAPLMLWAEYWIVMEKLGDDEAVLKTTFGVHNIG